MDRDFPRRGELLVGTVKVVQEHGATLELNEYEGLEAYIPRSHVRSGRIRDIRDFIKEGQRVVGSALRVDSRKGLVDVSLRYVSREQTRRKLIEWKERVRIISLVGIAANKMGASSPEELGREVWEKLIYRYESPISALIEATKSGPELLVEAGVEKELAELLVEEAKTHLAVPTYVRSVSVKLISFSPDGVSVIREALMAGEAAGEEGTEVEIYSAGSPRYVIKVSSTGPRAVKRVSARAVEEVMRRVRKDKGVAEIVDERNYKRRGVA